MIHLPNIAFIGAAGAGKSTAARVLRERFDLGYENFSWAEAMKVGLDTSTDRARLQEFGTDIVRRYESDFWLRLGVHLLALRDQVRCLEASLDAIAAGPVSKDTVQVRWTNDDTRFDNELDALLERGWKVVEVQATRQLRIDRLRRIGKLTDESQLEHASETGLHNPVIHGVLVNDYDEPDDEGVARKLATVLKELR